MAEEVSLVREHPVTDDLGVYTAEADFIDGDTKTYTYHEKEVKEGTIILYTYNTDRISTRPTTFSKTSIETETGDHYYKNLPYPPSITYHEKLEEARISLETCKDFNITNRDTQTVTFEDWSAVVDMPEDAALAYQQYIGEDKCYIE